MKINNDFHPDDLKAHEAIKRLCDLPADTKMTNRQAVKHALSLARDECAVVMTEDEDTLICEFIRSVA